MTKKELTKLRKKLPKNGISLISKQTGFSYEYVRLILKGKRENQKVIDAALVVVEQHQKELQALKEKINAL